MIKVVCGVIFKDEKKYIKGVNLTKNEATHPESESIRIIIIIATIVFTIP